VNHGGLDFVRAVLGDALRSVYNLSQHTLIIEVLLISDKCVLAYESLIFEVIC
jgi:hypothetical protein